MDSVVDHYPKVLKQMVRWYLQNHTTPCATNILYYALAYRRSAYPNSA